MANVTITDLSAGSALGGSELFEMVQTGASVKTTATAIKTFVGSSLNITGGAASSVTISSSTLNSCTINNAVDTGGTFNSSTINNATVSGGTFTNGTFNSSTINNATATGGTLGSVTINSSTLNSCTINAAQGSFGSLTITNGAIPFTTITGNSYGQLFSTRDQTAVSASVAYAVSFDTASSWNTGITLASSTNITFATAGTYLCSMNFQLANTDTANRTVTIWYQKNGTNVANTASLISVPKATDGGVTVFELTFQEQLTASQYLTLYWSTSNTLAFLDYTAASAGPPTIPAVASVVFTAHRVA